MKTVYDTEVAARLFETTFIPLLGRKLGRRIAKRARNPTSVFVETVVRPLLFLPETGIYTPVSDRIRTLDRNHDNAQAIATAPEIGALHGDPLQTMTYFANPLRLAGFANVDSSIATPKDRVVLSRYQTFTFEFDRRCSEFLRQQFGWIDYTKNPLECPMGAFYTECSRYSDFTGICVVYGGNKSLHIHVVFVTAQIDALASISSRPPQALRRGLIAHWHRLEADLLRIIDTAGHSPDSKLKYPEQYRRMPNAVRFAEADNLPGFPKDSEIPQVVVWEKFRQRAGGDELPMFFQADLFTPAPEAVSTKLRRLRPSRVGPMSAEQLTYCEARMEAQFPDYPRFHSLCYERSRWIARFSNSAADRTPSSIMREDYQTVRAMGSDADQVDAKPLPAPLASMLRLWCEQMPGRSGAPMEDGDLDGSGELIRSLEERFRQNVTDKASAHAEMRTFFNETVSKLALLMVVGPEGVGKTTTLFERYHISARKCLLRSESPSGMFAFAEYKDAETKCAKFNQLQAEHGFVGVVLPSFTRTYEEACRGLGLDEITWLSAIRDGFESLWDAICRLQPEALEVFRRRHQTIWRTVGDKTPVFFVVHGTMHGWRTNSLSRLMWAPSFWKDVPEGQDQDERLQELRKETTIGIAVHDEIKVEHVVCTWTAEVAKWVNNLVFTQAAWTANHRDIGDCLISFQEFCRTNGCPMHKDKPLSFEDVLEIEVWNASELTEEVIARDSGEYQIKKLAPNADGEEQVNVYEAAHGAEWRVLERDWWDGLAHQVVLLTTERVPKALIGATTAPWWIVELDAPLMPRNVVQVRAERSLTRQNVAGICAEFREMHPDTYIISNKAKKKGVSDAIPHVTARGSNDLIGKHVMQTMCYMTPGQYEQLQVLNAWAGQSDLVGLSHIDEFNQSAGRNLGFRWQENVTHTLLINRNLFGILVASSAIGSARYSWQPILNADQRSALAKKSDGTSH